MTESVALAIFHRCPYRSTLGLPLYGDLCVGIENSLGIIYTCTRKRETPTGFFFFFCFALCVGLAIFSYLLNELMKRKESPRRRRRRFQRARDTYLPIYLPTYYQASAGQSVS